MTISLYKLATKEEHTYETEGIYYFYQVCDESEEAEFVKQGWLTNFGELKGIKHEKQEASEEVRQKPDEEKVLTVKRGRKPKAQNVVE